MLLIVVPLVGVGFLMRWHKDPRETRGNAIKEQYQRMAKHGQFGAVCTVESNKKKSARPSPMVMDIIFIKILTICVYVYRVYRPYTCHPRLVLAFM